MRRLSRFLAFKVLPLTTLLVASVVSLAFAQGQENNAPGKLLTLERLYSQPSLSGRLTQGIEWCPDSKRFSYLERKGMGKDAVTELWTMDTATGERKMLVDAATLKAVTQPEKEKTTQATGLGRVQADNYQWSPGGDSLLFIGSNSLVLLDLKTMTPKPLLSGNTEIEDPKFSPDGKWVSFVRDSNLWVVNVAGGESKALTTGGSEEVLKGKLDWVYPEELDATHGVLVVARFFENRLLRNGRAPGDALSDHGHEFARRRDGIHALPASGRSESDRARGRGPGCGRRNEMDGHRREHGRLSPARGLAAR